MRQAGVEPVADGRDCPVSGISTRTLIADIGRSAV